MTQNIACRVFKEQIKLINQLPEKERATVLYLAINHCFNQIDNQNENQIDNQNENAYVSVSVSESLSDISKCVLELLKKNIVCKEFSNNYGGKRDGSGRKSMKLVKSGQTGQNEQTENKNKTGTKRIRPSLQEVVDYCNERKNGVDANKWYDYYTANGWKVGRNPMKDWKATVRTWEKEHPVQQTQQEPMVLVQEGNFYIDDSEKYCKGYADLVTDIPQERRDRLYSWFIDKFNGQKIKLSFVRSVLMRAKDGQ